MKSIFIIIIKQLKYEKRQFKLNKNYLMILIILLYCFYSLIICCNKSTTEDHQNIYKDFVFVKGGTFNMGNTFDKEIRSLHRVQRVKVSDFYMSKYEVTQEEWEEIMGYNPCERSPFIQSLAENLPVHHVSWIEAIEFCNKKSEKEGLAPCYTIDDKNIISDFAINSCCLSTEAEWEYAARRGNKSKNTRYSGSHIADKVAWCEGEHTGEEGIQPVGTKKPNELGIYDMSGNVWEWCWDWYDEKSGKKGSTNKPNVLENRTLRVIRSGNWFDKPELCTVYVWGVRLQAHTRDYNAIGLRLARSVKH
jgi:sulfatase modifying factor 1